MTIRLTILFLITTAVSFGQSQETKDSLINEICKTILETGGIADSARIQVAYERHLFPFLDNYPENQRNDIGMTIFFRLQRNCVEFKNILNRMEPPKGDWETVDEKPNSVVNKKVCRKFIDHINYTYLEANGDTVKLQIENGFWVDHFKDGTYSKLKLNWITDCEFEIEFIESNNKLRKGFSKPGDKYRYQVINKKDNYYEMSVEILGTGRHVKLKLYF